MTPELQRTDMLFAASGRANFRQKTTKRVRFAEVDGQRLLYHGRYLEYMDLALQEYWRACGLYANIDLEKDPAFHVVHVEVDYIRSIRLDELVDIWVRVERIGTSTIHFAFVLHGHDQEDARATGRAIHVHVDKTTGRPASIGEDIKALVDAMERSADP